MSLVSLFVIEMLSIPNLNGEVTIMLRNQKQLTRALTLSIALTLACMVTMSAAQDADDQETDAKLGIDLDATYVSKYIWRGYDLFDDHAAFQPSVNLDLFDTGFSINVWGSIPMGTGSNGHGDGINIWQEYDYTAAYAYSFFEDEIYALDFGVNYIYFHFPKLNHMADTQEIGAGVAMPNLLKIGDSALVPSYYAGKLWPTSSGAGDVAGGYHSFALSYDLAIPETDYSLSLFTDINYNDGLFGSDNDWSHATFGISTSVEVGPVTVTPFLNYQASMDDSVNDEDELYGGISVSFSF